MRRVLLGLLLCLLLFGCARPYAASGDYVYVVGEQGGLSVFNPANGEHVKELAFPNGSQAMLTADGKKLWLLSPQEGKDPWQMRSVITGAWLETSSVASQALAPYRLFIPFVTMSADGKRLFTLNRGRSPLGFPMQWVEIFDTQSGEWLSERIGIDCLTWRLLAAPNGQHVVALCDGQVTVMSLQDGLSAQVELPEEAALMTYYPRVATAGAFAKDGTLYVARRDGYVSAIDPVAGSILRSSLPELPQGWGVGVECLAVSPDGERLYLGVNNPLGMDGLTEIWVLSTATFDVTARYKSPASFRHIALSGQGESLYVLGKGRLYLLDAASGEHVRDWAVDESSAFILTPGNP